ncbi:MAG: acyl transferase [Bacteroidota bacterium]
MPVSSSYHKIQQQILQYSKEGFEALALEVFRYQATANPLYARFLKLLGKEPESIQSISAIPFLPISFFKSEIIKSGSWTEERIFSSSGTTGATTSRHFLKQTDWYDQLSIQAFEYFYGSIADYAILALLPAYLERQGSSLVHMADHFIKQSRHSQSGFFLYNTQELLEVLDECRRSDVPVILLGVSFALLDLAEQHPGLLGDKVILMETGGMKGRRKEIIREQLHQQLQDAFQLEAIHSEYGMTELLSQAYSKGAGIFYCPPSMKVFTREITDPLSPEKPGKTGAINIIDLANLDSCSFIATDDLGKVYKDGSFEVLGRMDNSDIRGCNLLLIS